MKLTIQAHRHLPRAAWPRGQWLLRGACRLRAWHVAELKAQVSCSAPAVGCPSERGRGRRGEPRAPEGKAECRREVGLTATLQDARNPSVRQQPKGGLGFTEGQEREPVAARQRASGQGGQGGHAEAGPGVGGPWLGQEVRSCAGREGLVGWPAERDEAVDGGRGL